MSNTIARALDHTATLLQRPLWSVTTRLYHIADPLDKSCCVIADIALRCLTIAAVLPAFGLALLSTIPRYLGTLLQTEPFRYYESTAEETVPTGSISLFSWNISAMHGITPTMLDNLIPWKDRMDRILGLIKTTTPDIVTLQEVHDEDCAAALIEGLKGDYKYFYYNIGQRAIGQNSGLFIASKVPIARPQFTLYDTKAGDQYLVNKGFFTVRVNNNFNLVVTHLQPRDGDDDKTARKAQWEQIKKPEPCIIAGDLNISQESPEYQLIASYNIEKDGFTYRDRNGQAPSKTLDYVLEVSPLSNKLLQAPAQVISSQGLSDHQALLAEITL